jgi:bifunctional N-acetylglutamate synthase/kinase
MQPAEAVLRFLAGVGRGSEAEFYLRLFRSRARQSFAALVVDPETMQENADGVALDLRLLRTLELTPVVVLGFYEPSRATTHARRLQKLLDELGVKNLVLGSTDLDAITAAADGGNVPVVQLSAESDDARLLQLSGMLRGLCTHKLIFLRSEGSLSVGGHALSVVNLSDEFAALMQMPDMCSAHKALLVRSRRLVLELAHDDLLITITSPLSLLHELFTVKGAGTLLRKGARIVRHEGLAGVDIPRLRELLTRSFGREPRDPVFTRAYTHAYVEAGYRGAALVAPSPFGAYMSKFAVTRQAQGEGVGRDLWQAMTADHRVLLWRARAENPIRSWYEKQSDTRVRAQSPSGEWLVFFRGVTPERLAPAIEFCLAQPIDI